MLGNNANSTVRDATARLPGPASRPIPVSMNFASAGSKTACPILRRRTCTRRRPARCISPLAGTTVGAAPSLSAHLSQRKSLPDRGQLQLDQGRPLRKFGMDFRPRRIGPDQLSNRFGGYAYTTLTNFARDFSGNTTGPKSYTSFTQTFGNPILGLRTNDYDFYAQDVWKINRKLTLVTACATKTAWCRNPNHQSRLSANRRCHRQPRTSRRASACRIRSTTAPSSAPATASSMPASTVVLQRPVPEQRQSPGHLYDFPDGFGGTVIPQYPGEYGRFRGNRQLQFAAPDFRNPYTQQGTLAMEHQFARDVGFDRELHLEPGDWILHAAGSEPRPLQPVTTLTRFRMPPATSEDVHDADLHQAFPDARYGKHFPGRERRPVLVQRPRATGP